MAKLYPDNVNQMIGIVEAMSGFGLVLGPSIGSLFYMIGGFTAPFYFMAICYAVSASLSFLCLSEKVETDAETKRTANKRISILTLL